MLSQDFSLMSRLDAIVNRLDRIADALEKIAGEDKQEDA